MNIKLERINAMPTSKAFLKLALPSVLSQVIIVLYNMADTYFVGLAGSDTMMSAITICMPVFVVLSAISNLFGIGGGAAYSRALGKGNKGRTENILSYSLYGCLLFTFVYAMTIFLFRHPFINLLGGRDFMVHQVALQYIFVTVVLGGLPTTLSALLSHLIRAEGHSKQASRGIILGAILNIVFDPIFMFVLMKPGDEVLGAAIATALSNVCALIYLVVILYRLKKKGAYFTFQFNEAWISDNSAREILLTGLPASLMTLFENISFAVLNSLMATVSIAAQAAIGVAKKINMLAHCIVRGLAQGVLPLVAFNYAKKNYIKLQEIFQLTMFASVGTSLIIMVLALLFGHGFVGIFLHAEGESIQLAIQFLHILCVGGPFSAFAYTTISFFQGVKKSKQSFLLASLRKGAVDIPLMFILMNLLPVYGIVMATPLSDAICATVAFISIKHWFSQVKVEGSKDIIKVENKLA